MNVARLLALEGWGFLSLLIAVIAYKILTRQINLSGLLLRKGLSSSPSPERVQLLLATIAMSARYLSSVAHAPNNALPDIDPQWLYLFGGSSAIYAAGKALTTFRKDSTKLERGK